MSMWLRIKHVIANYHARCAKRHYRAQRFALCLHYLQNLEKWDEAYSKQPMYAGYLAMCHFQLKDWHHLSEQVERALFLLRRHIQTDKEALLLWQELKSHLADLRYIDQGKPKVSKAI